ncbi:MAG: CPBP family intramembrane metalloprotease [Bacteroidetes bacterium]|nr:CPBP family intramembrane metalloprotease [Bacteroidota bacterium]MCB0842023.1 CPBP family intramembrane metalloprotease [Bacteroidota bacterium]
MIFVETELYRSINKYNSQISDNRFYEFVHLIFILLIYEVLLLFSYNPHVLAYNGVDAWFKFSQAVIPHGTLFVSLFLIINWGNYVRLDWIGEKDRHELRKDYDEKKKNKKFKPKPKSPFRPNWYYFGFMALEGFVYGSLIFALLRYVIQLLSDIIDPNLAIPLSLDSSVALRDFHTNFFQDISLAFGAGFYEELLFRGFLFVGIAWLAKKVKMFSRFKAETTTVSRMKINVPKYKPKDMGFWTVVAFGTLIYTLSHYLYPFGDVFGVYTILYRFSFGMIMFIIFVQRGLSVAVWTHVIYDLWYFIFL